MRYVFEDYELDTQRYELRRRGTLCPLEPQGFDVLVYLVQHRDRVVSKEELFAQLWSNQTVSESTLTHVCGLCVAPWVTAARTNTSLKRCMDGAIASSQS